MRVYNKYGDDLGDICAYTKKELYLMTRYKECVIKED